MLGFEWIRSCFSSAHERIPHPSSRMLFNNLAVRNWESAVDTPADSSLAAETQRSFKITQLGATQQKTITQSCVRSAYHLQVGLVAAMRLPVLQDRA
jgi:hypothetical protein